MNLQYKYWYFEKALPSSFCNDVIKHALAKKDEKKGGTFGIDTRKKLTKKQSLHLKKHRNSSTEKNMMFDAKRLQHGAKMHPQINKKTM